MKIVKIWTSLLGLAILMIWAACSKTDGEAYKKFELGGEIKYPGRPDTAIAYAGNNRIQLSVVLGNDPLVTKIKVFYNNRKDSLEVPVKRTTGKDIVNIIIPNLAEGNYNFDIYTYDNVGNRSVVVNAAGISYGDSYLSSLVNRRLISVATSTDGSKINLTWGASAAGELGIQLNYIGFNGTAQSIVVPASETLTVLPDYKDNSTLTYQSLYKPEVNAFETFKAPLVSITLPIFERQFDKSKFALLKLPTDVSDNHGWLPTYLWNESYNPPGFATQNQVPCWFTIDAGASNSLSRFKVWQANDRLYVGESVKTFELYGNNNPSSDGSFTSWTLIGAYTSIKPSGLPVGQTSAADITFAKAGEEFIVATGTSKFRYYRFKLLTNWGNAPFMTMEEITFYTNDR